METGRMEKGNKLDGNGAANLTVKGTETGRKWDGNGTEMGRERDGNGTETGQTEG
jgi:hypothetical protein